MQATPEQAQWILGRDVERETLVRALSAKLQAVKAAADSATGAENKAFTEGFYTGLSLALIIVRNGGSE
jgi:hypothetical protein